MIFGNKRVLMWSLVLFVLFLVACGGDYYAENSVPEPCSLHDVEISDFGRQVAEEFLGQFESLFFTPNELILDDGMFWWGSDCVWIDPFGNKALDETAFIRDFGNGRFLANNFRLYDLNHNGIPHIEITFILHTWGRSVLYGFVDGHYIEISVSTFHRFFYDDHGRVVVFSDNGSHYFDSYDNLTYFYDFESTSEFTEIQPLRELENEIRKSITERFFPTPPPVLWSIGNVEISDFGRQVAEEFLGSLKVCFLRLMN